LWTPVKKGVKEESEHTLKTQVKKNAKTDVGRSYQIPHLSHIDIDSLTLFTTETRTVSKQKSL
jgi:hypothetical protein